MAKYPSIYDFDKAEQTMTINGVTMLVSEYNKQRAANRRKKRRQKRINEIKLLPNEIKVLMRGAKVMRSLSAYYDWSYKQWGNIAKTILHCREIDTPFLHYRIHSRECNAIIEDIKTIGDKGEKNIFQFIQKLSYKMDDIRNDLALLYNGVKESGVCRQFKDHESINGNGKRLGLKILMDRVYNTLSDIDGIVERLNTLSEGVDILNIEDTMTLKERNKLM